MNPLTPLYDECSGWLQRLRSSPLYSFDDLPHFRHSLKQDVVGAYAIWLRLEEWKKRLCLKVGKAQRKTKSLSGRIYDHWHSRELPNPNVLAAHLMADLVLASLSGEDLRNQEGRRRLLERRCCFQVVEIRESTTARELAILECRLAAELEPRYIERCGGYPPLEAPGPESLQPTEGVCAVEAPEE
jgi:hypothetical protein